MSVTVTTSANLQVTGITLLAPPAGNTFPGGVPSTAVATVPPPQISQTWPSTLRVGQWIMDPSGQFVLILEANKGLSLYQVSSGNPTSGSFQGDNVFGPAGAGGAYFCAQADGNAVVYDSSFPKSLNPTWHANNGSGNAQYLFVQKNGCFVEVQCKGVWGSDL
jgi:hypothetical protein